MANTSVPENQKALQALAKEIAKSLGNGWTHDQSFAEDDGRDWRARIDGPNQQRLFLSNSWAKQKGMLYISGWTPDGVEHDTRNPLPSINVNLSKTPDQIAKDITRRLLPDYQFALSAILLKHQQQTEYKANLQETKQQVAEVLGVELREDRDVIMGNGAVDIQVTSPDSLRFHGHCLYLTIDQLKRIKQAVPELFERQKED